MYMYMHVYGMYVYVFTIGGLVVVVGLQLHALGTFAWYILTLVYSFPSHDYD